eukprot:1949992-Prorocentrum_lima.AAC.1
MLERSSPFSGPTTFAPNRMRSEHEKDGWADIGYLNIFSENTLILGSGHFQTKYGQSLQRT